MNRTAILAAVLASVLTAGVCVVVMRPTVVTTPRSDGASAHGRLAEARINANESAAIGTLMLVSSQQTELKASGLIDVNRNGAGEYGYFCELAGSSPVRSDELGNVGTITCSPPLLSNAFGNVRDSIVIRSGYCFQMWLPSRSGQWEAENSSGGGEGSVVDASKAEVVWCCYAWPTARGSAGNRVFFVNQSGDVLACENEHAHYEGLVKPPKPTAAFRAGATASLTDEIAADVLGCDGEKWMVVR